MSNLSIPIHKEAKRTSLTVIHQIKTVFPPADPRTSAMKAIFQDEYGADTFKLGELPKPTPGAGQVLIRVHAASVNPIDFKRHLFVKGDTFPIIAGFDVAGVVEELGDGDMNSFKVGDRVFGDVTNDPLLPKTAGAFAEYAVVKATLLAPVPESVTFEQAAALPVAVGTSMQAFDLMGLKSGQKVFISGGAGGVGVHAIQIAKSVFGASEVATTASEAKKDFVDKAGADIIIDYKKDDAGEVLKGWADVVLDCTGEPAMSLKVMKAGGSVRSIVSPSEPAVQFLMLSAEGKLMKRLVDAVAEGKLNVEIDTVYSLDDGVKAIKHVAGGRSKGKVVIKVC